MANMYSDEELAVQKEMRRLRNVIRDYERRLYDGWKYLMSVNQDELTVGDTLKAFGWTPDGLNEQG